MPGPLITADALSPAPILEAAERYRGCIADLDTGRTWGPDDFARLRVGLIQKLREHGVASGDRVVIAVANGPLFVATLTAVLACDASPLLVHFKTPPAEILRYAQRFGCRFLACDPPSEPGLETILEVSALLTPVDGPTLMLGRLSIDDHSPCGPTLRAVPLHPTSGSTGLPKIALRPGFAAMEEARHYAATMAIDASDWIVAFPPMSHAYGYGTSVMVPLLTGASIVTTHRFSVGKLHTALEQFPVTVLPIVPAMLDLLAFARGMEWSHLRWVLAAGAMLPGKSAEQFRQKTGVTVCPLYGTTETGGISVATAADGRDIDGRVGPPMTGVSVDVSRDGDASELGPDIGKLLVRSSSMMTGYLDEQGNITEPFVDGWFVTGDLSRVETDGCIHLRGRDSEVINVLGLKVVPCEVEEAIAGLPGVKEVKVYAGENKNGSQFVKAAVAVEGNLSLPELRSHCEQHLVYYKRPQTIHLVEALPRNPAGKIIKAELP